MAEPRHIYIFGDQTFDYGPKLRDLVRSKDHYLISFFEQVYSALRQEINDLPTRTQQDLGRFSNFAELVANSLNGPIHPSLEQTLTCTFQLASFIRWVIWSLQYTISFHIAHHILDPVTRSHILMRQIHTLWVFALAH